MSVSRESLVLLELLVPLDTRDLVACLVSVELLVLLEPREKRYMIKIYHLQIEQGIINQNRFFL